MSKGERPTHTMKPYLQQCYCPFSFYPSPFPVKVEYKRWQIVISQLFRSSTLIFSYFCKLTNLFPSLSFSWRKRKDINIVVQKVVCRYSFKSFSCNIFILFTNWPICFPFILYLKRRERTLALLYKSWYVVIHWNFNLKVQYDIQ